MRINRNEKKLVYHYTHLIAGGTIIQDGYLRVSEFEKKQGMRAALWFSKHEIYEPSALKHFQDGNGIKSFQSIHEQADTVGCVRFGYDDSDFTLHSWKEYCILVNLSRQERRVMEKTQKKQGATHSDWFCSFEDIKLEDMSTAEIWIDKWVEWTEDNLKIAMDKAEGITYDE